MQRQPVKSSNLAEVGFEDGILEVMFKGGETYRYKDVPEELYQSMLGAASIGNFFNSYIKTFYRTEKVKEEVATNRVSGGYVGREVYELGDKGSESWDFAKSANDTGKENAVITGSIKTEPGDITGWNISYDPTQREKTFAIIASYQDLITALKSAKPNDQSPLDRHFAVSITELEKAFAYYFTYVVNGV